ncbi:hypothetical protein ACLQ3C_07940 [Gordonia sp. DT30]|uniref:hypothetical protein n=1 Tax=unclassified Gordonia (in: high G+C Gram-positive bacteria) TaxID=2657482 RepID=UPI003CEF7173
MRQTDPITRTRLLAVGVLGAATIAVGGLVTELAAQYAQADPVPAPQEIETPAPTHTAPDGRSASAPATTPPRRAAGRPSTSTAPTTPAANPQDPTTSAVPPDIPTEAEPPPPVDTDVAPQPAPVPHPTQQAPATADNGGWAPTPTVTATVEPPQAHTSGS